MILSCIHLSCWYHEDMGIERIHFDPTFWEALKKLLDFYLYAVVPELLTGCVKRGIPV